MAPKFPTLVLLLFRIKLLRLPESALGDLIEEYGQETRSRFWLWRQVLSLLWPAPNPFQNTQPKGAGNMNLFSSLHIDLRDAVRTLKANPGFTAVAVLIIALGIGANTGIVTVLNGVALRPLPVPGARQIVTIYQNLTGLKSRNIHGNESFFSFAEYESYRTQNHSLSGLLAYVPLLTATLGGEHPVQLYGQLASCNYFGVLGESAALGRAFMPSDCAAPGAGTVTVLSDDLWRTRFASDPSIIGRKIVLDRQPFSVIGIAPPNFRGTEPIPAAFWAPLTVQPALEPQFDCFKNTETSWLVLIGRLKSGVTLPQVRSDFNIVSHNIDRLTPGRRTTLEISIGTFLAMPEERKLVTGVSAGLLIAVGMVLLIACANVANLLLTRAAARQKEMAIRLSLGATRSRLVRQLLIESVLIASLGGILGSLIAFWSFAAIVAYVLSHLPHGAPPVAISVLPDLRVFFCAFVLTLFTGVLFGLAPALQTTRSDVNTALKESAASIAHSSFGGKLLRPTLVGAQVAVSMVLLLVAGLLLRGLLLAQTADPGFDLHNVASIDFNLMTQGYDLAHAAAFQSGFMERLSVLPGVVSVAQASNPPLSDSHRGSEFTLPLQQTPRPVELNFVTSSYLPLLGIPITRGRNFDSAEVASGSPVAIVTQTTARRLWPDRDPIGKTFRMEKHEIEVIGVAKDAQVSHLSRSDETYMYLPAGPTEQSSLELLVRVNGTSFAAATKEFRSVAYSLDPGLVVDVGKLEDNLDLWRGPSRIMTILAAALGSLGLVLACVGLYGVVSYSLSRRVREIGIRMTLGANELEIRTLILAQAARPVLIGAVIGMALCAAVSRFLESLLFGISAHDPITFVVVPLFLLFVALLASYVPARRATKVDPVVALRYE